LGIKNQIVAKKNGETNEYESTKTIDKTTS